MECSAAELEIRAAEEPLKLNLDVARLEAQVLVRLEELVAREREMLLAELVPAREERGYDAGALRAAIDR